MHKYFDETLCKYLKNNPGLKGKKKARAFSAKANVGKDSESSLVVALKLEIEQLKAAREAEEVKKVYLDSGANVSIIADIRHVDINTIPLFNRVEEPHGVETANQGVMPIEGHGQIAGVDAVICSDARASLVSLGKLCDAKKASCVVTSSSAEVFVNTPESISCLNDLKKIIISQNTGILSAPRNHDSMYEITHTHVLSVISSVSGATLESCAAHNTVTGDTDAWRPSPELRERHQRWSAYYIKAMASYYNTAEFQTDRDLIRFFHEAWDHPSRELMCKIVDNKAFDNLPARLTSKRIRKHFPHCEACPANNMAQKPIPRTASDRVIKDGEEFQVDIKVFANNSKALKHKRAFDKYTGALTAIDLATRFKIGKLIKSHANLEVHLEALRVEIHGSGHTLKVLRIDNEFNSEAVKTWAADCEPYIELQPCIPHEHHSIGDIEKFNQTLENNVNKKLYGKSHLSIQYWGMAYEDYIHKANLMGSVHGPAACPYELWSGKKPDLLTFPMKSSRL